MAFRLLLAVALLSSACTSAPTYPDPFTFPQIGWTPALMLTNDQADRALGGPSHLVKTTSYWNQDIKTYQAMYADDAPDDAGKVGSLYFMVEDWPSADAATAYLDGTLRDNHVPLDSVVVVSDGTRLYWLTGGPVVRMAMIQRGNWLMRLKVNVVTERYGVAGIRDVAGEVAESLFR